MDTPYNHSSGTDCTECTDRRENLGTFIVSPFRASACSHTVCAHTTVWLGASPGGVGHLGAVGPHHPALQLGVAQSDPGGPPVRAEVLDESVLLLAVDGHQVGILRDAVLLRLGPGQRCGHVLVAATVEAEKE